MAKIIFMVHAVDNWIREKLKLGMDICGFATMYSVQVVLESMIDHVTKFYLIFECRLGYKLKWKTGGFHKGLSLSKL